MAEISRNFTAGKMNKVLDQRLVPNGEYVDAMNIRMGSTEKSEIGVIENAKGNIQLTSLRYIDGTPLSESAKCIGAYQVGTDETIYWFVHDSNFSIGATKKLDLIVSYNTQTGALRYHVVSIDDGGGERTTLNFDPNYLINGVDMIEDLLFFTDNYNAPRVINVTKNYRLPIADVDDPLLKEYLLVIKKPPIKSPEIQLITLNGQENFLDERYICFAYRYRYENGEYSATSQFSAPAFQPQTFYFSQDSYLNEGMTNQYNGAVITYNSGGPLVKEIELLFKEADKNIIKVIEKLNKEDLGIADYSDVTYTFSNSKIFTILPESELLRLYDNVPRFAQAQTIMGNRLMYGNYVEGYDLIDKFGQPVKFEYTTNLISESIEYKSLNTLYNDYYFSIDGGSKLVEDCVVQIDFTNIELVEGASINFNITMTHFDFSGDFPWPTETTGEVTIEFTYILKKDFSSVYQLSTDSDFLDAIGTVANIKPIYDSNPLVETSCDGFTFTDNYYCAFPNSLTTPNLEGEVLKVCGGIDNLYGCPPQPINVSASPGLPYLLLLVPAIKFINNYTSPTQTVYEYYKIINSDIKYQKIGSNSSLHSNRDYEIGIVYMDDFNRATTALVSKNNTVHIPCGKSADKNTIQVQIPSDNIAPSWATRYKFVIKPNQENYDVIYSSIFFKNPDDNMSYFLLEGENARKVQEGDRFIVKADADGALGRCAYATVLQKEVKAEGWIEIESPFSPGKKIKAPAGVYMKINPNSFSVINDASAVLFIESNVVAINRNTHPIADLVLSLNTAAIDDPPVWEDISVPEGSRIILDFYFERKGPYAGNAGCERRIYTYRPEPFISSRNYDNFYDWFVNDKIYLTINNGSQDVGAPDRCDIANEFINTVWTGASAPTSYNQCINYWQFWRKPTGELSLTLTSVNTCDGRDQLNKRRSKIKASITIFRADNVVIFETEPSDALPDVWYENDLSLPIDTQTGYHEGNIQNQTISNSAIIDTKFFNCFAFGNGAESYKIRDSIIGHTFNLGNRVTSVSAQDYKAAHRFADITYSGIYNTESNVNKLNEFNLGLLNYKYLESSYGPIYVIDGRETDVLVLQEDKISYVLQGKNLLSDAAAGGAITSVPEVLGTQIARVEEYGISFNPESYVNWGWDRYFTDVKRGAVLQLKGNSYNSDQLKVVSEMGMRTWFRDVFNEYFPTQKLGGYDPYMNEYVLSINENLLPQTSQCNGCGFIKTFDTSINSSTEECVDLGQLVGDVTVSYIPFNDIEGSIFNVKVTYDGITYNIEPISGSGSFTFNKNKQDVNTMRLTVASNDGFPVQVEAGCPQPIVLNLVEVVITSDYDSSLSVHCQYKYVNGSFYSPLQSNYIDFIAGGQNPLVSRYNITTGFAGMGSLPPEGSTLSIISNKLQGDTFDFNPAINTFRYLQTNTLYVNNDADILSLLSDSNIITPNQGSGGYNYAEFTVPGGGDYLYLIWDLRTSGAIGLCYSDISQGDACCNC